MTFGQPFGFTSFGNPITLLQFIPIAWDEICDASVAVATLAEQDTPDFVQTVDQLWTELVPNEAGSIIKRC